ncbi:MAG TPA: phage baseplate assembly protein V [Hyphomicrobiales bacterium]|nr:phage baseplate assembly protein V [Hyphomicrobiales bacterium]
MTAMNPHAVSLLHSLALARVRDNADPEGRGRIKVQLLANDLEVWASVVVPSAGQNYGIAFLPRQDEIVAVAFITPEQPLVLGSIWSGAQSAPEDADPIEEHYVVRTPAGTVLEFDDQDGPKVEIRTPQGYSVTLNDGNGGEVVIRRGGQSVTLSGSEINVVSSGKVSVQAANVDISAAMVKVDAGMSKFSGVVQADTVIANAVVGTSYTPGAGNIW